MSVLRNIESKIAGAVEGTFARVFKSQVRPIEIARKLVREMEEHKVQSLARTYVPNEYIVWLSPGDRQQFTGYEGDLAQELSGYLLEYARSERLSLTVSPTVEFRTDENLRFGEFGIQTRRVSGGGSNGQGQAAPSVPAKPVHAAVGAQPVGVPVPVRGNAAAVGGAAAVGSAAMARPVQAHSQVPPGPLSHNAGSIAPQSVHPHSFQPSQPAQPPHSPQPRSVPPLPQNGAASSGYPQAQSEWAPTVNGIGEEDKTIRQPSTLGTGQDPRTNIRVNGVSRSITSPAVIGRSRSCEVVIDDPNISRRHAQLEASPTGQWFVRDLGSTNGVRVNGRRINDYHSVVAGDTIELGSARVVLYS